MIPFWNSEEKAEVSEILHLYTSAIFIEYLTNTDPKTQLIYAICSRSQNVEQAVNSCLAVSCNKLDEPIEATIKVFETDLKKLEAAAKAKIFIPGFGKEKREAFVSLKEVLPKNLQQKITDIEKATGLNADVAAYTIATAIATRCPPYLASIILLQAKIQVVGSAFLSVQNS